VSFLPVFTLEAQEGRLFKPLAYTKTFAMAGGGDAVGDAGAGADAALHSRRIMPEAKNPVNPLLIWLYRPVIAVVMRWKAADHRAGAGRLAPPCPGLAPGQRVHAHAQRGHAVLHADHAAGHVGHQGRRAAADAEPDHQELPRGGLGVRQGRVAPTPPPIRRRWRCSRP
jgi:hypothetical protein